MFILLKNFPMELVQILKELGYHSSEWKEMDPEEEWLIVQPEITKDDITVRKAIKEKTSSIYIYNKIIVAVFCSIYTIVIVYFIIIFKNIDFN